MKKHTLLALILTITGVSFYKYTSQATDLKEQPRSAITTKPDTVHQQQEVIKPLGEEKPIFNEVVSVSELHNDFSNHTEEELRAEIKKNEEMAKREKLFEKANSGNLDPESSNKMVEFIRVNRVLHQILLDRGLEELEREFL